MIKPPLGQLRQAGSSAGRVQLLTEAKEAEMEATLGPVGARVCKSVCVCLCMCVHMCVHLCTSVHTGFSSFLCYLLCTLPANPGGLMEVC